jgi:hypothetical protein
MFEKDPTTWPFAVWLLGLGMAACGGFVNWYTRIKAGHTRPFNIIELMGEMFVSGFTGIATFMFLISMDANMALCAAGAGIGGHMATRILFLVERLLEAFISKHSAAIKGETKE